jgi:hypothetical protein
MSLTVGVRQGFYAALIRVSNSFPARMKRLDHRELVVIVRYRVGTIRPCLRKISTVRSNGSASTVRPLPVVVVALNSEL